MTDWSGALAAAFQSHLAVEDDRRRTTGTTSPAAVVPRDVPEDLKDTLGFAALGTTGTTGTTQIRTSLRGTSVPDDPGSFNERAAIVEDGARVPRDWAEAFARLDILAREQDYSGDDWRKLMDDAGRFLDRWGVEAARLGWSANDVFGIDADFSVSPGCKGLVPLIGGGTVTSIGYDRATIRMPDGGIVVILRRPGDGLASDWECARA